MKCFGEPSIVRFGSWLCYTGKGIIIVPLLTALAYEASAEEFGGSQILLSAVRQGIVERANLRCPIYASVSEHDAVH